LCWRRHRSRRRHDLDQAGDCTKVGKTKVCARKVAPVTVAATT